MKELIADPQTTEAKKMPDYIQKVIKDLHSEPEEIKSTKLESEEFDEKQFLSTELASIGKKEFGVEIKCLEQLMRTSMILRESSTCKTIQASNSN